MSDQDLTRSWAIKHMYETWFLDYASYVILERALPAIEDGLKPVQRRLLYAMHLVEDGRYNKVANVIGQTMQYHPHGDAAIGDALVHLGQKKLLVDTQGNWGDLRTGDGAAAPRYIEARLSHLAKAVLFNDALTPWQPSYDGRKKEPVTLPVKFPLLLAHGAEGIAVGLATKILPHNVQELLQSSIAILQGEPVTLLPDFPTGGLADCSAYNDGQRGGRVRVRARIHIQDQHTLRIQDIPFGTTTSSLIDSILRANQKGKVKIKSIIDNTAEKVDIIIKLPSGQAPTATVDALYVFTDCEVSLAPNACVIKAEKPAFVGVTELLTAATFRTRDLLQQELELQKKTLQEKILHASLEQIFIENRIYRAIEACTSWEGVLQTIQQGLLPYQDQCYRPLEEADFVRLTEIKIKRISQYDSQRAAEQQVTLKNTLQEVNYHLNHLKDYATAYFTDLLTKYGASYARKTELCSFANLEAQAVALNNQKLYVNRKDGFIGFGLKKDEYVTECSDLDDILVIHKTGTYTITRAADKNFVGKQIEYVGCLNKEDARRVFNIIYLDGKTGHTLAKRFQVTSFTRNKVYDLTQGHPNSKLLYLSDNPNGEAEVVTILLSQGSSARKKVFDFDFAEIAIKGRGARGNLVTKHALKKIKLKSTGASTLGGIELFYDPTTGQLNTTKTGRKIGSLTGNDQLVVILHGGQYLLVPYKPGQRYDPTTVALVEQQDPNKVFSAAYYDGGSQTAFVKRFKITTSTLDKPFTFLTDAPGTRLLAITASPEPCLEVTYRTAPDAPEQSLRHDLSTTPIQGWKTRGVLLSQHIVTTVKVVEPVAITAQTNTD